MVTARTDLHATYNDVQAARPDWVAVGADGKARRHWASAEMWVTCGLGLYNFGSLRSLRVELLDLAIELPLFEQRG